MDDLFTDAARQLLSDIATPERIRAIEAGGSHADLWQAIHEAGFADAMVPEAAGGAGLRAAEVFGVIELCGELALPVPLAETMAARGLLAQNKHTFPFGSIVMSEGVINADGSIHCPIVRSGKVADHVLVRAQSGWYLLPVAHGTLSQSAFCLDASIRWPVASVQGLESLAIEGTDVDSVRTLNAMVAAGLLSGALRSVFQRTLQYANDRVQFGRPIGKFQAIQHQLAVMSEHVVSARMSAQIGCSSNSIPPDALRVAVAKSRTSEAALAVAELSHSIHGAIGFTEEYDLQLLTRRLHLWRQTAGAESYWHEFAGNLLVNQHAGLSLDLLRRATDPSTLE